MQDVTLAIVGAGEFGTRYVESLRSIPGAKIRWICDRDSARAERLASAEHFTEQQFNQTGWGWSCLVVAEFLLELRAYVTHEQMRQSIDEKCVQAFRWCIDRCQFEDGAHGMFRRDDKWVGQTAAAVLLYVKLAEAKIMPSDTRRQYLPKITKSWQWVLSHTGPETYPKDGYIKVDGSTTTKPPENLLWMISWTIEALLAGGRHFEPA